MGKYANNFCQQLAAPGSPDPDPLLLGQLQNSHFYLPRAVGQYSLQLQMGMGDCSTDGISLFRFVNFNTHIL